MTSTDDPPLTGLTFGGRLQGWLMDPIVQCLAFIVILSAVFLILPGIDIWFTSLFAAGNRNGFPVGNLAFFQFLRAVNQWLTAIIPIALLVVLLVKVAWPHRRSLVPPAKTLFILLTEAVGPGIVVNLIFKSFWGRPRPNDVSLFGQGDLPFVPPWVITNYCPGNCSFVSGEGSSAIWLLSLAVLVPKEWRMTAVKAIAAFAVAASLNRIAFGGHYLSDVLLAWGMTLLIMAVAYRYILERPLPMFENALMEAELTRLGVWIRKRLGFPTPVLDAPVIDVAPRAARNVAPPAHTGADEQEPAPPPADWAEPEPSPPSADPAEPEAPPPPERAPPADVDDRDPRAADAPHSGPLPPPAEEPPPRT